NSTFREKGSVATVGNRLASTGRRKIVYSRSDTRREPRVPKWSAMMIAPRGLVMRCGGRAIGIVGALPATGNPARKQAEESGGSVGGEKKKGAGKPPSCDGPKNPLLFPQTKDIPTI